MSKIKIAIAVQDEQYGRHLAQYIPHCFSAEAEAELWSCTPTGTADILLQDETLTLSEEFTAKSRLVIFLTEKNNPAVKRAVYKYQCADALLNHVLRIYQEKHPFSAPLALFNRRAQIIALFSAGGGEGKTTLAVALSIQAAWEGKRVFYLNLENTVSTPLYFAGEQVNSLSNALYALKYSGGQMREKLEAAICTDPSYRIDFFKAPDSLLDLQEDLGGELGLLTRLLAETGRYDRIFIDLSGGLQRNYLTVLDSARTNLLVCVEEQPAELKTHRLWQELSRLERGCGWGILNKTRIVFNKVKKEEGEKSGALRKGTPDDKNRICARIPWTSYLMLDCGDRVRPDLDGAFGAAVHQISSLWES